MPTWLLIALLTITVAIIVVLFAPLRLQLDYSLRERRSSFAVRVSWLHQAFIRGDYCSADGRLRVRFLFWRFNNCVDTDDASDKNSPSPSRGADPLPHISQQAPQLVTNTPRETEGFQPEPRPTREPSAERRTPPAVSTHTAPRHKRRIPWTFWLQQRRYVATLARWLLWCLRPGWPPIRVTRLFVHVKSGEADPAVLGICAAAATAVHGALAMKEHKGVFIGFEPVFGGSSTDITAHADTYTSAAMLARPIVTRLAAFPYVLTVVFIWRLWRTRRKTLRQER